MSTNFYAHYTPNKNNPVAPTYVLHIGKRVSKGLAIMNGYLFPTVEAWTQFLKHNKRRIQVLDEYGVEYSIQEFIEQEFNHPGASTHQIKYLHDNGHNVFDHYTDVTHHTRRPANWLDGEQLFYGGEFC